MSKQSLVAVQLTTTHTTTGNPRRVWALLDGAGDVRLTVDEGYIGWAGVLEMMREYFPAARFDIARGPSFEVTPKQYRDVVRFERAGLVAR